MQPTTWTTTPITADLLRGALDLQRTARGVLPRTRATAVELDTLPTRQVYQGLPARPAGLYDLLSTGS